MDIVFSRHARRRMALYGISRADVVRALKGGTAQTAPQGRKEVTDHRMTEKYGYPLKVVYTEESKQLTVVTAYPLKKERKRP